MKDFLNICLGATLTLAGSLFVLFVSNRREKKKIIETLQSEIVGICNKLIQTKAKAEVFLILCTYLYRLTDLTKDPMGIEAKRTADIYNVKQLDSLIDYGILKSELLERLIRLYNYLEKEDIIFLKDKYKALEKVVFQTTDFNKCSDEKQLNDKKQKLIDNFKESTKVTEHYKILDGIKKRVNIHC